MTRKPLTQGDEDGLANALTLLFPSRMDEAGRSDVFKVVAKACKSEWPGIIWNGTNVSDRLSRLNIAKSSATRSTNVSNASRPTKLRSFSRASS
jgi:hypothetical protein